MPELSEGLDLADIDYTSPEEVRANLAQIWSWRGPQYEMYTHSLYLDYAADFGKLSRWSGDVFGRRSGVVNVVVYGLLNLHTYMMFGWETGIRSQCNTLRRRGVFKRQLMEMVMFCEMYSGMRGLAHVYHAVGDLLPAWGSLDESAQFPEGWAPDPLAFKCGLDLSTRELTEQDQVNLSAWYERTIGYVPDSITFGIKYSPRFVKLNRARWEATLKTVPKQIAPCLMLRHDTITGVFQGLREAALLAKAWGVSAYLVAMVVTNTAQFNTHFEGLYAASKALEPILEDWD